MLTLKYFSQLSIDLVESKQTKAWPEGTKGFSVSSRIFSSYLSNFFSNFSKSLKSLGTQQKKWVCSPASKSILKYLRSLILDSIWNILLKGGTIWMARGLPLMPR